MVSASFLPLYASSYFPVWFISPSLWLTEIDTLVFHPQELWFLCKNGKYTDHIQIFRNLFISNHVQSLYLHDTLSVDVQSQVGFCPRHWPSNLSYNIAGQEQGNGLWMRECVCSRALSQLCRLAPSTISGGGRVPRRAHIYQEQGPVNVDKEIHDLNSSREDRQARGLWHRQSGWEANLFG